MNDQNNQNQSQDSQRQPGAYYDGSSSQEDFRSQFDNQFNNSESYNNQTYDNAQYNQAPNNTNNQNSQGYNNMGYNPMPSPKEPADALSIVSLVCSILSVVTCCLYPIAIVLSIVGIVCGLLSKKVNGKRSGIAIAGITVSIIMLIVAVLLLVLTISEFANSSFKDEFEDLFKELKKLEP